MRLYQDLSCSFPVSDGTPRGNVTSLILVNIILNGLVSVLTRADLVQFVDDSFH